VVGVHSADVSTRPATCLESPSSSVVRAAQRRTRLRIVDGVDNELESDGLYDSMEVTGRLGEDRQYGRKEMQRRPFAHLGH
jgi:hypothetical protein